MVKACGTEFWPSASCAVTVMGNDPVVVGVPESTPSALKFEAGGNAPVSLQLSGASPPVAVKVKLYGKFSAPAEGAGAVLITGGGGGAMLIVYVGLVCVAGTGDAESVTVTITL